MTEADKKFMAEYNRKKKAGEKVPTSDMKRFVIIRKKEKAAALNKALGM